MFTLYCEDSGYEKLIFAVIFVSSNIPGKSIQNCWGDCKNVFKRNIVDRSMDRASFGRTFSKLDRFCLPEFMRYYYLLKNSKYNENDYQPHEHLHKVIESSHNIEDKYPRYISLLSSKEKLKYHKITLFLQFHLSNNVARPE